MIHVLDRLGSTTARARLVSLICIGRFPGHPLFKGLGELRPEDLASLFDTRQRVGAPQYDVARRAWHAFRSSTPAAIETLLHDDLAALPFLAAALRRHLEEFPATTDGLSRTERRVLELVSQGPTDVWQVFSQMHNGETAFYIADASFLNLVRELADLFPPLLAIDGVVVQAAPDGLAVLNGLADRVALCGIDRWLGGVHLEGRDRVWRWDPNAGRVTVA